MVKNSEINSIFKSVSEQARALLQSDTASIWMREDDKIVLRAAAGYTSELIQPHEISYQLGEGLTGYIAQGKTFRGNTEKIAKHPARRGKWDELQWGETPVQSFIGVPILFKDKVVGVMKVESRKESRKFVETDLKLLETLADLIATLLQSKPDLMTATPDPYVFVLIPFSDEFQDIYELGIKSTVMKLGMRCERVDEIEFNDAILSQIYAGIQRADLVVAEMTGRNPNVFYEVGYTHALTKEVILLTQKAEDIPFDLKGHNHIVYEKSITLLQKKLEKRLKSFLSGMQQK